mgnify:CR=1 FL=1
MSQAIGIAAAFVCMPFLTRIKKIGFGGALVITGLLMSLFARIELPDVWDSFQKVFTTTSVQSTMLAVIMIGMLGTILNQFGILQKIVTSLEVLIHNPKIIMMLLPAILGMLPVPGGAILSAPFVNNIGEKLNIPPNRRSVINLTFRHVAMYVVPFGSAMLLIDSIMPDIGIYRLIALNIPLVILYVGSAYFFHLRKVTYEPVENTASVSQALKDLILYSSPIYSIVLINLIFGLPMWISVLISVGFTFFLVPEKNTYLTAAVKGINLHTLFMLVGVYFVQNLIKGQASVMDLFSNLFLSVSGFSVLLVIMLIATVLGLSTGLNMVSLGILLPLVQGLPISVSQKLLYVFFIYIWSFIGYYYSPLHLCQILSNSYVGCGVGLVTKENIKLMPILAIASFGLFYIYGMFLL